VSAGVVVAGKNLDTVKGRLELATPSVTGDRWIIAEIAQSQEEVWTGGHQAVQAVHRSANSKTPHVSRGSEREAARDRVRWWNNPVKDYRKREQ